MNPSKNTVRHITREFISSPGFVAVPASEKPESRPTQTFGAVLPEPLVLDQGPVTVRHGKKDAERPALSTAPTMPEFKVVSQSEPPPPSSCSAVRQIISKVDLFKNDEEVSMTYIKVFPRTKKAKKA